MLVRKIPFQDLCNCAASNLYSHHRSQMRSHQRRPSMKEASVTSLVLKPPQSWVARVIWTWCGNRLFLKGIFLNWAVPCCRHWTTRDDGPSCPPRYFGHRVTSMSKVMSTYLQGNPRHKAPGLVEVLEDKLLVDCVSVLYHTPPWESWWLFSLAFAWCHLCWSEAGASPVSQWCQAWQQPSSRPSFYSCSETSWMEQQCSVYKSNCSNRSSSTNLLPWERSGRVNCSTWTALLIGFLAADKRLDWQLSSWLVALLPAERRRLLLAVRTRILEWGRFKPLLVVLTTRSQESRWQQYNVLHNNSNNSTVSGELVVRPGAGTS